MGKFTALAGQGLLVIVLGTACGIPASGSPAPISDVQTGGAAVPGSGIETPSGVVPDSGAVACVDWVRFESPQDLYDHAGMVLIGKPAGEDGETSIYGYRATRHLVEVERVLKGEPGGGTVRISSTPVTCTAGGESYPDGDSLDTDQRVIIFASKQGTDWFTLTPAQGVLPFEGKQLPFR
ncbi:MAG: hypothetical protein HOQ06_01555 [Pseudarthrobacter sp.]|nr:hypothetical protein [Pseudarthrobacter sp.]